MNTTCRLEFDMLKQKCKILPYVEGELFTKDGGLLISFKTSTSEAVHFEKYLIEKYKIGKGGAIIHETILEEWKWFDFIYKGGAEQVKEILQKNMP